MNKRIKQFLTMLMVLAMVLGLTPQPPVSAATAKVKQVKLNKTQYVLAKGGKVKLKAAISPKKAQKGNKVTWKSSNKKIATVSAKGVVKAKAKKGTATITAKAGKKKATCKITIGTPVKKVEAADVTVTVGGTQNIAATVTPEKATIKTLQYKVKDAKIATVDKATGLVTGVSEGSTQVTIYAADCMKVKKTITVTVTKPATVVPAPVATVSGNGVTTNGPVATDGAAPAGTDGGIPVQTEASLVTAGPIINDEMEENTPTPEPTPAFSLRVEQAEVELSAGEEYTPDLIWEPEEVETKEIFWTSSDSNVATSLGDNKIHAFQPGTTVLTGTAKADSRVTVSIAVTVVAGELVEKTVSGTEELLSTLASVSGSAAIVRLETQEEKIVIPEGDYSDVTLIVNAPKATVTNNATFKDVLIESIAEDTWKEKSGNTIYINGEKGHIITSGDKKPSLAVLGNADSVTVENNGKIADLLIAESAKVMVKGDSIAYRVPVHICNRNTTVSAFVPLDIESTSTFSLTVGPNGEETAVVVKDEKDIPKVNGIGTISISITKTGEKKTVIAENDGSLGELPVTEVKGKVLKLDEETEDGTVGVSAKLYLVPYTIEMNNDNTSVYLSKEDTKTVNSEEDGTYSFSDVMLGNYVLIVEADGYQLVTQNVYVGSLYIDKAYEMDDVLLLDTDGEPGAIQGTVVNVQDNQPIAGIRVILRKGMNNITSNKVADDTTGPEGKFTFSQVTPGQYTVQLVDDTENFMKSYENISVLSGGTSTKTMYMSKKLDSAAVRFVLTWGTQEEEASADLDLYLYGPDTFNGSEYSVHFDASDYSYAMRKNGTLLSDYSGAKFADLDVDDKEYEGPETITVSKLTKGKYKLFVKDFSNAGAGTKLTASKPVIKVYSGTTLKDTIKMTATKGGVWYVGDYNGETGKFTVVDEASNEEPNECVKAKIGTVFNKLTQFEIEDAEAFASYQATLTQVENSYLKETDKEKLEQDLEKVEKILKEIEETFTLKSVTWNGGKRSYTSYCSDHSLGTFYGSSNKLEDLNIVTEDPDSTITWQRWKNNAAAEEDDSEYYKTYQIKITSKKLGLSTLYYVNYSKTGEPEVSEIVEWVKSVKVDKEAGWKTDINNYSHYIKIGGYASELPDDLEYVLMEGARIREITYLSDLKEDDEYYYDYKNRNLVAILHLEAPDQELTADYKVYYYPIGVELKSVSVEDCEIYKQSSPYSGSWDSVSKNFDWCLYGSEKKIGKTITAEVEDGASYTVYYPDEDYSDQSSYMKKHDISFTNNEVAIVHVTRDNGAYRNYHIYYSQDDSEAQILGVYDPNNLFTSYSESTQSIMGKLSYVIKISGVRSTIGNTLQVALLDGAQAEIEYATASASWEISSDAKITVTAENGAQRIYYIDYSKSALSTKIAKVAVANNTLYKYYLSETTMYVYGENKTIGKPEEVSVSCVEGYTAVYKEAGEEDAGSPSIVVTETETGATQTYTVSYKQDRTGLYIKKVKSASRAFASVSISTSNSYYGSYNNGYETIQITGFTKEAPVDLEIFTYSSKNTVKVIYAKDVDPESEDAKVWADRSQNCFAEVQVTDKKGRELKYLVYYNQDTTRASVSKVEVSDNAICHNVVSTSTDYVYEEGNRQNRLDFYPIYLVGDKPALGDSYNIKLTKGAKIANKISVDDDNWKYEKTARGISYTSASGYYGDIKCYPVKRFTVVSEDGEAEKQYIIYYGQDYSGAIVQDVTATDGSYVKMNADSTTRLVAMKNDGNNVETKYEQVRYLVLQGAKGTYQKDLYKLQFGEGTTIKESVSVEEESWPYTNSLSHSVSLYDEEENYCGSDSVTAQQRIVVEAPNGARVTYVIFYRQYKEDARVLGFKDEGNTLYRTEISSFKTTMDKIVETDEETGEQVTEKEEVYPIYIVGKNKTLGDTYKLELSKGAKIITTQEVGTEKGVNYTSDMEISRSYCIGENSESLSVVCKATKRVEVQGANGGVRVYLISYGQDYSDTLVQDVIATDGSFVKMNADSDTSLVSIKNDGNNAGIQSEKVRYLVLQGAKETYQKDLYKFKFGEGTEITESISVEDENWPYNSVSKNVSLYDENGNYCGSEAVTAQQRIVVKAQNGASVIYVICYRQYKEDARVDGFKDEKNTLYHTEISSYKITMDKIVGTDENTGQQLTEKEEVYPIYIVGDDKTLGDTYVLELAKGAKVVTSQAVGTENGINYTSYMERNLNYQIDEDSATLPVTCKAVKRVEVQGANGGVRVYLIYYGQDRSGAVLNGIEDTENTYLYQKMNSYSYTSWYDNEQKKQLECDCFVVGENDALGNGFTSQMPEGTKVASQIVKDGDEWPFTTSKTTSIYVNNKYMSFELSSIVTVEAKNGAQRTYGIWYTKGVAKDFPTTSETEEE